MIAENLPPIKFTHGSTFGKESEFYSRVIRGRQVWQRKPTRQSALQKQLREQFGKTYGTARKKNNT